jgi:hypothetical protein
MIASGEVNANHEPTQNTLILSVRDSGIAHKSAATRIPRLGNKRHFRGTLHRLTMWPDRCLSYRLSNTAGTEGHFCESHLHFDGKPFAGTGADDLPAQLPLNVQINAASCLNYSARRRFRSPNWCAHPEWRSNLSTAMSWFGTQA